MSDVVQSEKKKAASTLDTAALLTSSDKTPVTFSASTSPLSLRQRILSKLTQRRMGGVLALADQIVCSATSLITFVLLARLCEQDCVGAYALAMSLVLPLRVLQDRMIATPYMMLVHRDPKRAATRLGSCFIHEFFLSAISIVIAVVCAIASYIFRGWDPLTQALSTLVLVTPALLVRDLLRSISFSHLNARAALIADTAVFVVQMIGLALCVMTSHVTVFYTLLVTAISSAFGCFSWRSMNQRNVTFKFAEAVADWKENWSIAKWLVAARVFGSAGLFILPWIIAYHVDDKAAGVYATCLNLVGLSFMFSRGLNNYFRPHAIEAYQRGTARQLRRALLTSSIVFSSYMLMVSLLFAVAGNELMSVIYGPQFSNTGAIVLILSFVSLATSYSIVGDNGITALNRPDISFWAEMGNGIITVLLAFLLVPQIGLSGAGWSNLIGQIFGALLLIGSVIWLTGREVARDE